MIQKTVNASKQQKLRTNIQLKVSTLKGYDLRWEDTGKMVEEVNTDGICGAGIFYAWNLTIKVLWTKKKNQNGILPKTSCRFNAILHVYLIYFNKIFSYFWNL